MPHTPGPWKTDIVMVDNAPDRMMVHVAKWGGENIADCGIFAECNPDDARLIAAAPDLLEACKGLHEVIRKAGLLNVRKHFDICLYDAAIGKAIDKAEGR